MQQCYAQTDATNCMSTSCYKGCFVPLLLELTFVCSPEQPVMLLMWYQALTPHLRLQKIQTAGGYSSAPALSNKAQALAEIACASWRLTLQ